MWKIIGMTMMRVNHFKETDPIVDELVRELKGEVLGELWISRWRVPNTSVVMIMVRDKIIDKTAV